MNNDRIKIVGTCEMILRGPDGRVKSVSIVRNDVTDKGFDKVADLLGSTANPITHLGIGWGAGASDAFDPTENDLQGANKDRKSCSYAHTPGTKTFVFTATWGPGEPIAGTAGIEEVGTFDAASGGDMFSRLVRAILNKLNLDTLEVNYNFTMS